MEDVKTDENLADETVHTEDAVFAEKEIEGAEACGDDGTQEHVPEEEMAEEGSKEESGKKRAFSEKKEREERPKG